MTSLLERLCGLLAETKAAKGGQPLTYADFIECVKTLREQLPANHSGLVSGSKLSRADANKEAELLK